MSNTIQFELRSENSHDNECIIGTKIHISQMESRFFEAVGENNPGFVLKYKTDERFAHYPVGPA
jgi:hypothetical protein